MSLGNLFNKKPASTSKAAVASKSEPPFEPDTKASNKQFSTQAAKTQAAPAKGPSGSLAKKAVAPVNKPTIVKAGGLGFMKTGAAKRQMMEHEEARAEARKEERGKLWRFWMNPGEERQVTFLDGYLGDDGLIDAPAWYEHEVKVANVWDQYACTFEQDGWCPLCQRPNCNNYAIHVMTIIEHTPHEVQKGKNKGNIIQHRRKLYTPKMQTMKKLTAIAQKHGGLAGMTIDITRSSDEVAKVGDGFEIINKAGSYEGALAYIEETFGVSNDVDEETGVARFAFPDYEFEIGYKTADELVSLGLGDAPKGPGYGKGKSVNKAALADKM